MVPVESNQEILDSTQYSTESIQLYEAVFGEDFVSPGGYRVAEDLIKKLKLPPGSRVLDAGCGLGGNAFIMASKFGLMVDGIDLSRNMLAIATKKLKSRDLDQQVNLQHGDCLQLDCRNCYDAIYSRDVFLHIENKSRLFSVLYSSLKAGGKLLFTDYCCGEKPWDSAFANYVEDRGYYLHTLSEYCALMRDAGFVNIESTDLTLQFVEILQKDMLAIESLELSVNVRNKLRQSWEGKLERARSGDHRWGLFTAIKCRSLDQI
ncbi:MAG: methyltransferase domain-containing protein [Gammaproteobacteria bacterium]|nr:methyltransferase domain-containing protein [Gammaproteobacteria bacterium]